MIDDTAGRRVDSRDAKIDRVFAAVFLLFFIYTVLVWRGVIGDGKAWRPGQTVLLAGALLTQSLASLVVRRSRVLYYCLLAGSLIPLAFALFSP